MADHAVFREYLQLLRGLEKTVGQLVELERKKAGAVRANDVQLVDDCIRQEQVLSLSLRGAEQKRAKMLKELGLEHVKLFGLERDDYRNYYSDAGVRRSDIRLAVVGMYCYFCSWNTAVLSWHSWSISGKSIP